VSGLSVVCGGTPAPPQGGEFEIGFVDAESGERRMALTEWSVPFEECLQVRGFPLFSRSSR
jgi:hypothetical protein